MITWTRCCCFSWALSIITRWCHRHRKTRIIQLNITCSTRHCSLGFRLQRCTGHWHRWLIIHNLSNWPRLDRTSIRGDDRPLWHLVVEQESSQGQPHWLARRHHRSTHHSGRSTWQAPHHQILVLQLHSSSSHLCCDHRGHHLSADHAIHFVLDPADDSPQAQVDVTTVAPRASWKLIGMDVTT